MSNSIWHKYDIKDMPSLTREILARNGSHHNVCIIDREDWEQGFCEWIDRWTYITDIIAQADKAERLEKAVDLAVETLKFYADRRHYKDEELDLSVYEYSENEETGVLVLDDGGRIENGKKARDTIKQMAKGE